MKLTRRNLLKLIAATGVTLATPEWVSADPPTPRVYFPFVSGIKPIGANALIINGLKLEYDDMRLIQTYSSLGAQEWDGENIPEFDVLHGGFLFPSTAYLFLFPLFKKEKPVTIETLYGVLEIKGTAVMSGLYQGNENDGFTFAYLTFVEPNIEDNR